MRVVCLARSALSPHSSDFSTNFIKARPTLKTYDSFQGRAKILTTRSPLEMLPDTGLRPRLSDQTYAHQLFHEPLGCQVRKELRARLWSYVRRISQPPITVFNGDVRGDYAIALPRIKVIYLLLQRIESIRLHWRAGTDFERNMFPCRSRVFGAERQPGLCATITCQEDADDDALLVPKFRRGAGAFPVAPPTVGADSRPLAVRHPQASAGQEPRRRPRSRHECLRLVPNRLRLRLLPEVTPQIESFRGLPEVRTKTREWDASAASVLGLLPNPRMLPPATFWTAIAFMT
jgi:hypothetical protein